MEEGRENEKKVEEILKEIEEEEKKVLERVGKVAQKLMNGLINVNAELRNWQNLRHKAD